MIKQIAKIELGEMLGIGITIAVVGMAMAFALNIGSEVKDDLSESSCANNPPETGYTSYDTTTQQCTNGTDYLAPGSSEVNATNDMLTGLAKLPSKLPLIVTVIVAAIIIGLLVRSFAFKQ